MLLSHFKTIIQRKQQNNFKPQKIRTLCGISEINLTTLYIFFNFFWDIHSSWFMENKLINKWFNAYIHFEEVLYDWSSKSVYFDFSTCIRLHFSHALLLSRISYLYQVLAPMCLFSHKSVVRVRWTFTQC